MGCHDMPDGPPPTTTAPFATISQTHATARLVDAWPTDTALTWSQVLNLAYDCGLTSLEAAVIIDTLEADRTATISGYGITLHRAPKPAPALRPRKDRTPRAKRKNTNR